MDCVQWAFDTMIRECPKTCNYCPGEIIDLEESCAQHAMHCTNPVNSNWISN